MDEQDFDWAKRYLESLGYVVRENYATAKLSVLQNADLADTAIMKANGDVLVTYQVRLPSGARIILRPPQIVELALTCYKKNTGDGILS